MSEWMPIESAPKNIQVLAYWEDNFGGGYGVAMFEDFDDGSPTWIDPNDFQQFLKPSYWMPLPPPPKDDNHE